MAAFGKSSFSTVVENENEKSSIQLVLLIPYGFKYINQS